MLNLLEEAPPFCRAIILNTVYLTRVINKPQQFYSYRTIWEYGPGPDYLGISIQLHSL